MKLNAKHYRIIHKMEKKYGSLMKTPDRELKGLWRDLYEPPEEPHELSQEERGLVCKLITDGYSYQEILDYVEIPRSTVKDLYYGHNLTPKKPFQYEVEDSKGNHFWAVNKSQIWLKLCRGTAKISTTRMDKKFIERNLNVKKLPVPMHWVDIKDGSLYVTQNGIYAKHGKDSYEHERLHER